MLKRWLVFVLVAAASVGARAQVVGAVKGLPPKITLGGTLSGFNPDYTLERLYGLGAYADVVPYRTTHFDIGLEGELQVLNLHQIVHVHEFTTSIGPIVSLNAGHGLQPFAKVMYGYGNFYYPYFTAVRPKFYQDSYGIWVFGGGLDYKLTDRVTLRGAYEYQDWTHFRGAKTLNPNGPMIGVSYRFF